MSERTVEEIRAEIDAERQRLNEDLTALRTEARSLAVVVAAGLVVVALVTWRKGSREGITAIWKLAR
ncbi:MAG TPA: hypothetical protein VIV37_07120 [Gaiellaceae bacterium]